MPEGEYYSHDIEELVRAGNAQVLAVNKSFKIDRDTMHIKSIINTDDKTYIRYRLVIKELGWSFPEGSLSITDNLNNEYQCLGGGSSGKFWGQDGLIQTYRLDINASNITINYRWFDRQNQLFIELNKDGEADEK